MGFWISLLASVVASWLTAKSMKNAVRDSIGDDRGTKVNKQSNIAEIPVSYGKRKYGVSKSKLMKMFFLYTSEAIKLLK